MSDQHITNANRMRSNRYEIEPRPLPMGGGWRIRFFGRDLGNLCTGMRFS